MGGAPKSRRWALLLVVFLSICQRSHAARHHTNSYGPNERMDLRIYVSPSSSRYKSFNTDELLWEATGLSYCDGCDPRTETVTHKPSAELLGSNKTGLSLRGSSIFHASFGQLFSLNP